MVTAYLSIGSNVGNRLNNLEQITELLGGIKGVSIKKVSSLYETAPFGGVRQRNFFNAVIKIKTNLSPLELLSVCNKVEKLLGRKRTEKNGPRTADIDILLFGSLRRKSWRLSIPHRQMTKRRFVLVPLTELAPGIIIPGAGKAKKVLTELKDDNSVIKAGVK